MAADSPYKTLSNIRLAILTDSKETTSSQMVTMVDRWINEGHEQVALRKKRDWLDQQFTVQVNAAVSATCSVTNGSTTVTFASGTTFVSGIERQFYSKEFEEIYDVASSTSNVITLSEPYLGETSTAATGVVFQSSVILDTDIRSVYQVYHQHSDQPLVDVGPQQMRAIQEAHGPQLDYARYMSIFGQAASSVGRRLVLFPYPLEKYTLYIDANTYVPLLSSASDEPVLPMQYRQILYWYGLYKLFLFRRNDEQAGIAVSNFNQMLSKLDGEMRAELDFPQIQVRYPRRRSKRSFIAPFDPRMRDD